MKVCPRCNAQNSDNATNCTNCGFNFMQNPQHQPIMPQQPIPQAQINPQTAYYYGMKEQKKKARKTALSWEYYSLFLLSVRRAHPTAETQATTQPPTVPSAQAK